MLLGDWIVLRAARDLRAGDAACHYYCDVRMPQPLRADELRNGYGFEVTHSLEMAWRIRSGSLNRESNPPCATAKGFEVCRALERPDTTENSRHNRKQQTQPKTADRAKRAERPDTTATTTAEIAETAETAEVALTLMVSLTCARSARKALSPPQPPNSHEP